MPRQSKPRPVGRAAAAKALGVTPVALSRMVERGAPTAGKSPSGRALYDVAALRAWRARRAAAHAPVTDLATERAKLARSQRRYTDLRYRRDRGDLLPRAQVVAEGQSVLVALRGRLLALPRQATLAGVCTIEQEPALRALLVSALRELSRWSAAPPTEQDAGRVVAGPWSPEPGA